MCMSIMRIHGETVYLVDKTQTGTDPLGAPITADSMIQIDNVLVSPVSSADVIDDVTLTGKHVSYMLCIPKTDNHDWANKTVIIRGQKYRTIGEPYYYTEANIPLDWNGKVAVERYE